MKTLLYNQVGKRRWLKRILLNKLPEVSSYKVNGNNIYFCLKDMRGPSFYLNYGGQEAFYHYELEHKKQILKHLGPDKVFFDIGANIGLFAVDFKLKIPKLRCHSFEPEPVNFKCLEKTANELSLSDFYINQVGLSNKAGKLHLHVDINNSGGASIEKGHKRSQSVEIEVVTLDSYVKQNALTQLDVIKIDVEDHEEKVIEGGAETIKRYKPIIFFECLYDGIEQNNVVRALKKLELSFKITNIKSDKKIDPEDFDDFVKQEIDKGRAGDDFYAVIS